MIERAVYASIALALAALAWFLADAAHGNYADLGRLADPASKAGGPEAKPAFVYWLLIAIESVFAFVAGLAGLFFLFVSWALEAPGDSLNDPQWRELLFRNHPKKQLREWALSMRYFRFIRGPGGGMNDYGDRLAVVLKAGSQRDIDRILAALATPDASGPRTGAFDSVRVGGVKVDIHVAGSNLELSITDSERAGEVTQAAVDAARSVEALLDPLADRLVDPPQDDKYCVCPKYYPTFWKD